MPLSNSSAEISGMRDFFFSVSDWSSLGNMPVPNPSRWPGECDALIGHLGSNASPRRSWSRVCSPQSPGTENEGRQMFPGEIMETICEWGVGRSKMSNIVCF